MKFFSLESSKKLDELGCVSCSGSFYFNTQLFLPYDFLSSEEYALENCKKLWGESVDDLTQETCCYIPDYYEPDAAYMWSRRWAMLRHKMLDARDQIAFVEQFIK